MHVLNFKGVADHLPPSGGSFCRVPGGTSCTCVGFGVLFGNSVCDVNWLCSSRHAHCHLPCKCPCSSADLCKTMGDLAEDETIDFRSRQSIKCELEELVSLPSVISDTVCTNAEFSNSCRVQPNISITDLYLSITKTDFYNVVPLAH